MSALRVCTALVLALVLMPDSGLAQTDSWQRLSDLKRDDPIVIYLKSGGRMKQRFASFDQNRLVTDVGDVARRDIAAVSLFRAERLWDGTLRGGAIGVGTLLIPLAAYEDGSDGVAAAAVLGFLSGAGLGALFDAGVAKPDKPIYTGPVNEQATLRRWTLNIPHEQVAGWLRRQRVQLMLKDGTYVRGTVIDGTPAILQIDVRESSRQGLQGNTNINTSEIGTVVFRQKLDSGSAAAAATGGAISGFWAGGLAGLAAGDAANENGPAIVVGALGGALAGGLASGLGISHLNTREITLMVE